MKISESQALTLFDNSGISHPRFWILTGATAETTEIPSLRKLVVKANLPLGGKKKSGLLAVCDRADLKMVVTEILDKSSPERNFDSVLVQEFVEHNMESFFALRSVREGIEAFYSSRGGVDIEGNWDKVQKMLLTMDVLLSRGWDWERFTKNPVERQFFTCLTDFFLEQDGSYLEINPYTIVDNCAMPLGIVLEVDDVAEFRHKDRDVLDIKYQVLGGTERERAIAQIDSQIKGSVKLVEVPIENSKFKNQNSKFTALMAAGAGAALYLADAILDNGLVLANYAEFSGNPPSFAVTELTKQVCAIPGIKNLVIGSGIANFTPVKPNMEAIIEGLKHSPQAESLHIVVRRCGPGEEEGVELMKKFAKESGLNIEVFGRETGMTEIVKYLITKI